MLTSMFDLVLTDQDQCHIPYVLNLRKSYSIHLELLGIIEPVQFSDWDVLIVAVLKVNGELHVCGNYKLSVK